jgi:hypothetical protein
VPEVLNSERFKDQAAGQVYATLLRHPAPEFTPSGPNQVWLWDNTKLVVSTKWTDFYLSVILGWDIFNVTYA